MTEVTSELLASLVTIDAERKECKAELERLQEERNTIEALILDEWEQTGDTQRKVNGVTIYLGTRTWWKAKGGNREAVVKVLQSLGMTDYVTFNTQSLSSFCNEMIKMDIELPEELLAVTESDDVYQIKTRGHK